MYIIDVICKYISMHVENVSVYSYVYVYIHIYIFGSHPIKNFVLHVLTQHFNIKTFSCH